MEKMKKAIDSVEKTRPDVIGRTTVGILDSVSQKTAKEARA
jgi:hypothetical protein